MTGSEKGKWTPGKWRVEFDEYGGYDCMTAGYRVLPEGRFALSIVTVGCPSHAPDEQAAANARLIAAAPEMVEALRELVAHTEHRGDAAKLLALGKAESLLSSLSGEAVKNGR